MLGPVIAIESGARPSLVIADFARDLLSEGPASTKRPCPWVELLRPHEMIELSRASRAPCLLASYALGRILPSFRGRFEIRASFLSALKGHETGTRQINLGLFRNWNQNAGAQANHKNPNMRDCPAPAAEPARVGTWRPDPVNAHYLKKFLELTARHGITVVWIQTPCSPGMQVRWDHSGDEAPFDRFIRATVARHPNLVVLDACRSGFPANLFWDVTHLDRDGAPALSALIADFLHAHPKPTELASRIVRLPGYQPRAIDIPVEDVAQSTAMVQALLG